MKTDITNELKERIELNYNRLADGDYYKIGQVFSPDGYDWPGDKEGRALLAFVSHYKISGTKIPCMEQMVEVIGQKLNSKKYFGEVFSGIIDEQQLSGHSWVLRGLCEYYEQCGSDYILSLINAITENLYLPTKGLYNTYPTERTTIDEGGVSGSSSGVDGIWKLSTDIGCAFMSIDGLSHVYKITLDSNVKELVDETINTYLAIDKLALKVQTHCTLTAARGMMRMHSVTGDNTYLAGAKEIYDLYVSRGGMTYTYQNLNWWGRPDSWTEPCAIVDSLMLALDLYKATNEEAYRRTAARIYHNGFATMQRDNGGAGTDNVVCKDGSIHLAMQMYEAYFCCTMRLAEGLWSADENKDLLYAETTGKITKNENGIYTDGDVIYCLPTDGIEEYGKDFITIDGLNLCPIIKLYNVPKEVAEKGKMQIIF